MISLVDGARDWYGANIDLSVLQGYSLSMWYSSRWWYMLESYLLELLKEDSVWAAWSRYTPRWLEQWSSRWWFVRCGLHYVTTFYNLASYSVLIRVSQIQYTSVPKRCAHNLRIWFWHSEMMNSTFRNIEFEVLKHLTARFEMLTFQNVDDLKCATFVRNNNDFLWKQITKNDFKWGRRGLKLLSYTLFQLLTCIYTLKYLVIVKILQNLFGSFKKWDVNSKGYHDW